jgi:CRP/FNR family cyclic AMP-dependent transcriptional regulator
MAIPDLLKSCPLFLELYDKEVEKIVKHCHVLRFEEGQKIVHDGEEGDQIYVVLEGRAAVQKEYAGVTVKFTEITHGDVVGELVLIDERTRTADIVAMETIHVLEIRYEDIFKMYKTEPNIFGLIMLNLSRLLARKLRKTNELMKKKDEAA